MNKSTIAAFAAVLITKLITGITSAEEPPKRSGELAVLDKFVGTWDLKTTVKAAGQEPAKTESVSYRTWSKGGKFVLFDDPWEGGELHLPLTYDAASEKYRGVIISGATPGVVTATWEAETSTMKFVIENADETTYRGSHRFVRDGYAEASGKITDAAGKVIMELSWKQTRRKTQPAEQGAAPKP